MNFTRFIGNQMKAILKVIQSNYAWNDQSPSLKAKSHHPPLCVARRINRYLSKKVKLIWLLSLLGGVFTAVHSQPAIIVDPEDFQFELPLGNRESGVLNIANVGDTTLDFTVSQSRVGREGIVRILIWTAFVNRQWDLENIRISLTNLGMDYRIEEYAGENPEELNQLLIRSHTFLIPDQKEGDPEILAEIGAALSGALYNFTEQRGGIIVALDSRGRTADFLRGADLLDIEIDQVDVNLDFTILQQHPVTIGIEDYHAAAACNIHSARERDAFALAQPQEGGGANITARHIGPGGIVYIGLDWFLYNNEMSRLLTNSVLWSQGAATWLLIDDYLGLLEPDDSEDIIFTVNSGWTRETGHYRRFLNVRSNDPQLSLIQVPVDLIVTQRQPFEVDLSPNELFVITAADQDSSVVVTIHNAGRGGFEATVRFEEPDQGYVEMNRDWVNIGPGSRDRIVLTFHGADGGERVNVNYLQFFHSIIDTLIMELPILFYSYEDFGTIEGTVTDHMSGEPVPIAEINIQGLTALTDSSGVFSLNLPPFRYRLLINHPDYLSWSNLFQVNRDQITAVEAQLDFCTLETDLEANLRVGVEPDTVLVSEVRFENNGSGDLNYSVAFIDDNPPLPLRPWEQRWEHPTAAIAPLNQVGGVVFDGEHLMFSAYHGAAKYLLIADKNGERLDSLPQPAGHPLGMADLAWDGSLFWGTGRRELIGFNLRGETIQRIPTPLNYNRAIAYDRRSDLLWIADIASDLIAVNRQGEQLRRISNPDLRIYGLAFLPDAPDGSTLYIFSRTGADNAQIFALNPETGDAALRSELSADAGEMAAGVEITSDWDYRHWTILAQLTGGECRTTAFNLLKMADWATINPAEGNIRPGEGMVVELNINSYGLDIGDSATGQLIVNGGQRGGPDTFRVVLNVVSSSVAPGGDNDAFQPNGFRLNAYPNPFNGQLAVTISNPFGGRSIEMRLYDLTGRVVKEAALVPNRTGAVNLTIDARDLPSALYFLNVKSGAVNRTQRVVLLR